jgi:hypothetical protein
MATLTLVGVMPENSLAGSPSVSGPGGRYKGGHPWLVLEGAIGMRQLFLTKEDLIRYLEPLNPNARIEFAICHEGKTYRVDHIRGFSRLTDPLDGQMVCTLHLEELEEI